MSFAVVVLQILACLGAGAVVLRLFGLNEDFSVREKPLWAFALGLGVLGWLVFPLALAGLVGKGSLLALEGALAAGCVLLSPDLRSIPWPKPGRAGWTRWALAAVVFAAVVFDLAEALAPPLDADSLAYHFARPLEIVRAGRIEFVPRAVDGAGAFLVQMTYVPPLALGGERALTLWAMASGWAAPLFLYAVARRWLAPLWAAAATLLLATTPAWLYGAGAGQVEPRLALFAFAGLLAAAEARKTGSPRLAVLAGLMAGFYAAGKFSGLFFVAAAGLTVILQRNPWRPALLFAAAALVAGVQWYAWNYAAAGDPLFPGLFSILGVRDPSFWNEAMDAYFRESVASERPARPAWAWLFAYPFAASVGLGYSIWDAGRTGFGPYGLLILPFVLAGLWRFRARLAGSLLSGVALGTLIFYVVWFLVGPSQRIRHFIPLLPAFLLCATVAAERYAAAARLGPYLASGVALALAVHMAANALFALPYLRFLAAGESRGSFLARHLTDYAAVQWLNANLSGGDRVLLVERHLKYHIAPPLFDAAPTLQALIDLRDSARDARRQWTQMRKRGITHLLLIPGLGETAQVSALSRLGRELVAAGCAEIAATLSVHRFMSRTLPAWHEASVPADVLKLRPDRCVPERLPAG
ncbi:MAG: hypothetical protein IT564_04555 [Rhodospirillales bacterium]|nr:hypothetical protein [Rhodospirillales bacterium]